ncbi:MAG: tRNA-modifying protein YgfZ [Phycisphaeraceae bacterium]|nr:MAG: tRNA-modifying protein YgfZ [Phycisphaeraceae bacterium]
MTRQSPLRKLHQQAEASFRLHPPDAPEGDGEGVEVVDSYGDAEAEYASLHAGCILMDRPDRGVIRVAGADRHDFLNRMLTQELKGFAPFQVRRSFWLNRKGRIEADLRLIALENAILFDLDTVCVDRTLRSLDGYIITEDVQLADESDHSHRLSVHGPASLALLQSVGEHVAGAPLSDLVDGAAALVRIAGCDVIVDRHDCSGSPGVELLMPAEHAAAVYQQLLEQGGAVNGNHNGVRPAGWSAFDVARLEASRPQCLFDFGHDDLPHETGVLKDRVSFTKGCFLGQEIVARMQSLGRPKKTMVRLRFEGVSPSELPHRGDRITPASSPDDDPIGSITTAAPSPQHGGAVLCFAQLRTDHATPGAAVLLRRGELRREGVVLDQPG